MTTQTSALALLQTTRIEINKLLDDLENQIAGLAPEGATSEPKPIFKTPTLEQARDTAKNKNGRNLTERGVEILYRLFDDGAGYNRAAKALDITQTAAKHRKSVWENEGGLNRTKRTIDIDLE